MSSVKDKPKAAAKALLLEDNRYRAASIWKNEQGGEACFQLFAAETRK